MLVACNLISEDTNFIMVFRILDIKNDYDDGGNKYGDLKGIPYITSAKSIDVQYFHIFSRH